MEQCRRGLGTRQEDRVGAPLGRVEQRGMHKGRGATRRDADQDIVRAQCAFVDRGDPGHRIILGTFD